jgi:hypothetical protein
MFPVFIQPTKQLFLDILDWNAFAGEMANYALCEFSPTKKRLLSMFVHQGV